MRGFNWLLLTLAVALTLSARFVGARQVAPQGPPSGQPALPPPSELLTHSPFVDCAADALSPGAQDHLRIVTWNIQAARAAPVSAIAAELQLMQADVVALQEVDVRTRRTGLIDEPAALASALGFDYVFAASIKWDGGDYGLAVLSRWPLADARRYRLDPTDASEPRIILETTICAPDRLLHLFNHHADNRAVSRDAGFATLRNILLPDLGRGMLLVGDFNERADGVGIRSLLDAGLVDLGALENVGNVRRIDYLMADDQLALRSSAAHTWLTDKSDHNAVLADLRW